MLTGHARIDQRSLALHRAIAEKLRAQPDLLDIARDNLDRWQRNQSRSQPYWDEWRRILGQPLEQIIERMLAEGDEMTALRQSSPFAGVLDPKERWQVYDSFQS